jgi:hypothetical protein
MSPMKTNESDKLNLREGGKEEFETTNAFARQASEIRKEVIDKYAPLLLKQRSWLKRFFIKLKRENEIRKRIQQLSSWKNLHAKNQLVSS